MIDAHFHIWRLERGDYGWLTPSLGVIHRDVAVEDWQSEAVACGVRQGIIVQAAPTEAETAFLLEQAARHPGTILGVVGWADLSAEDAATRIEQLAEEPLLLGLRPMLQDIEDPDWILRDEVQPGLDEVARRGLTFDALIKPIHLSRVPILARRHPGLRIVVDHGAKPDIAAGAFEAWAEGIARIAAETSAFCKLSGLLTEAGVQPDRERLRPYVEHLLSAFGPERLLWGSDWPVLELAGSYGGWHAMARDMVPEAMRDAVFERNARRAYPRMMDR